MRLFVLLATTVLLAGCVHDTDDFTMIPAESGASLTYYIGLEKSGEEDPWDTINQSFPVGTRHTGKVTKDVNYDDPWDTINEKYPIESRRTGLGTKDNGPGDPWDRINANYGEGTRHTGKVIKSDGEDDPWDTIQDLYAVGTRHTGKLKAERDSDQWNQVRRFFSAELARVGRTDDSFFMGLEKSAAVFLSFGDKVPLTDRARVVEVRGRVLKLVFADGVEQYVIDAPATWLEGMIIVTGFLRATSKKDRPFLGVRFWRLARGEAWDVARDTLAPVVPDTVDGELVWPDPWDRISAPAGRFSW